MLRAMKGHPISQRRACVLIGVDPKTVRREHPPDNPEIRLEMNKIAEKRRRFGYRRIGVLLEREGMVMNEKKLYRIYREEGLSVRRRRGRKRARGSRTPMPVPLRPNQRWSLDFLADTFGACRKFPHDDVESAQPEGADDMRKSRFTEAQIIGMIKEQEAGLPTAELCRKHGLSPATFYKLKAKYGGMDLSDAKRLKQLEDENAKLKRLVADVMLDNVVLKDLLGKP